VARAGSGKLDLPTRTVAHLDDGRTAVEHLALEILGKPTEVTLVGYVRNVVESPDAGYPWPTPLAHFSVWEAVGEPAIEGVWLSAVEPDSPLRDRHWWPLVVPTQGDRR
jgi:hypothetical protein